MSHNKWWQTSPKTADESMRRIAEARQANLTKPPGALGKLETSAIQLAALQASEQPKVDAVHITVFAGDHGVAAEGISAFPQAVTAEMIKNFASGGAAISVIAAELGATLEVVNLGTVVDPGNIEGVKNRSLGPGTQNFCQQAAMSETQVSQALDAGYEVAQHAKSAGAQLFIGGEMGIGNTTVAAALACAFLEAKPELLAGPGTGVDAQGVRHKIQIIQQALDFHLPHTNSAYETLRRLGGFEIAALSGSYLACAQIGLPVLVDGFISSVAALAAIRLCPDAEPWFLYSHTSAEPGHRLVLKALNANPLLDCGMRLGEGSGAASTVPLLRLACSLHNHMATFAEAGVSEKS
ncbi:MAG: nicotinate-nucleotide--dimethylbenzimidazole phosphoribosyltransferase [Gammaproteobacteria bacterium]|nr:nicotinate-nucleotide--dimethylbenzimidazole phosphoribosyltransferase [Gammaproteobacteria bacterium]